MAKLLKAPLSWSCSHLSWVRPPTKMLGSNDGTDAIATTEPLRASSTTPEALIAGSPSDLARTRPSANAASRTAWYSASMVVITVPPASGICSPTTLRISRSALMRYLVSPRVPRSQMS